MSVTSTNSLDDHKLINFNVPKYLIKNFDNLVRFKRVSRTSVLIRLMESFIRDERIQMEKDGSLNVMITDIENRNRKSMKDQLIGLKKDVENEYEPPMIPMSSDEGWEERLLKL